MNLNALFAAEPKVFCGHTHMSIDLTKLDMRPIAGKSNHSCLTPVKADLVNYYLSPIDLTARIVTKVPVVTKMRSARFDIYAHAYRL